MKPFLSMLKVSYSDTDQMGIVHHSNYLKYYENARWQLFRHAGIPYKTIEESGFLLPVINLEINYLLPAYYDDVLTIETTIKALKGPKIILSHTIYNHEADKINQASTTIAFVHAATRKPCRPPAMIAEKLSEMVLPPLHANRNLKHHLV